MIRFIDLTGQIDDEFQFAWFNTVCDKFLEYSDCQVWSSWLEFEIDFKDNDPIYDLDFLERLRALFPKEKPKSKNENIQSRG